MTRFTTDGYIDRELLAKEIHEQGFPFASSVKDVEGIIAVVLNELFKGFDQFRNLDEKAHELLHVVAGIVACAREDGLVDE